jgi:dipicolinate synthase subunit B
MQKKNVYVVPFGQDDPVKKPTSLKADMSRITEAAEAALEGRQLQPVLL